MRYVYSVVRFVPDPVRGEFVNIGIIAGSDDTSDWEIRTIGNLKRARCIDDAGLLGSVWPFVDEIGQELYRYSEKVQGSLFDQAGDVSEDWLKNLARASRNLVQFSDPGVIVAEDVDAAIDTLFDQFIVEPQTLRFPFKKKTVALAAVRNAYRNAGLVKGRDFLEGSQVIGGHHRERFDFVVANGHAAQLAQTWSFQLPNQDEITEQVKAWAWTVEDIRRNGGKAEAGGREIAVDKDVDIEVVYVAPNAGGSRLALDEAMAAFERVDVRSTQVDNASDVGRKASELMAARI